MRDDNMAVSEVQRQIEGVALAVKQGSGVSDLRHHTFTGKLKGAQVRKHSHRLVVVTAYSVNNFCNIQARPQCQTFQQFRCHFSNKTSLRRYASLTC